MFEWYRNFIKRIINASRRIILQKKITPKQIAKLPLKYYQGEVHIIEKFETVGDAIQKLLTEKILGFDIESKPAFTKGTSYPPSLMQLAGEKDVYIFKLGKIGGLSKLKPVLESGQILKVGIGVDYDIKNLFKIEPFTPCKFYDLAQFSKKLHIGHTGLRNLAAIFLRIRISKKSQLTDWSQDYLTSQQISYAATDAWASREIFLKMSQYLD